MPGLSRVIVVIFGVASIASGAIGFVNCPGSDRTAGASRSEGIILVDAKRRLTPFDTWNESISRLEPNLLAALQNAARAAEADGVTIEVNWGWRSPETQQRLLDDAVKRYGSYEAARQYVQTPEGSKHVAGQAVDIGSAPAIRWMNDHGPRFGLCRIYANESWHFELAADELGNCPPLRPDAAGE